MHTLSIIFSVLAGIAILAYMGPGILAMNRGKVLRNIALWLAIILALAFAYNTSGL